MIYQWLFELSETFSAFNVFRYITVRGFLSFFTAFLFCLIFGPVFIKTMKKKLISETINTDAPDSHIRKKGTPTMGGVLIILSFLFSVLLWIDLTQPLVLGVIALTLGFALVGFWDDWRKLQLGNGKGLSAVKRLLLEFALSLTILFFLYSSSAAAGIVYVPFFKNLFFDLGWWWILFGSFVIVGFANAVNLTDGLDGLAVFPIVICAMTLGVFSYLAGHFNIAGYLGIPFISGAGELAPLAMAAAAAGLGFLWYNAHPAQIFMGDVGSLSMGGFLGILAVVTKNELLLPVLGGVFVVEAFSVISQVFSFQLTGRRIFSMAPLHHHFELKGVDESKIIIRFWIVSLVLCLLSLAAVKLR